MSGLTFNFSDSWTFVFDRLSRDGSSDGRSVDRSAVHLVSRSAGRGYGHLSKDGAGGSWVLSRAGGNWVIIIFRSFIGFFDTPGAPGKKKLVPG